MIFAFICDISGMVMGTDFIFFNYVLVERGSDSSSIYKNLWSKKVNRLVKAFLYYLTIVLSCTDRTPQHMLLY